ncbi:MAG: hypothetical protein HFJ53_03975 [Clostridia bacterium]|nr:hypothetical protein [Clostridia bacterium]
MSYAIIRNEKYKRENLKGIYCHNERRNKNYSNKNIDKSKSHLNYSIKEPTYSYEKEFDKIREKYNLKGQVKTVSNIVCEYIITSDKEFFESIGEKETKRYFETAYKFVCEYKNLGEQYILSAKVHLDEETPHLHLVFIPVVHTADKKGNAIDKIACSEFWKDKDSYIQLQNAFYSYITENGFDLERGKSSSREHLSVKDYKEITNYEKSKQTLKDIKIELPNVPSIKDFGKLTVKRDERIQKEIIEPKDKIIDMLYSDNKKLHQELEKQINAIDKAEKLENERQSILQEKVNLENKCIKLEKDFYNKEFELKRNFDKKYNELLSENIYLNKIINTFEKTIKKFISWV